VIATAVNQHSSIHILNPRLAARINFPTRPNYSEKVFGLPSIPQETIPNDSWNKEGVFFEFLTRENFTQ
jgi:hypothetical protein